MSTEEWSLLLVGHLMTSRLGTGVACASGHVFQVTLWALSTSTLVLQYSDGCCACLFHCTFPLETSVLLKSVALVNCQGSQCIKPSGASRAKKVSDKYINLEAQVVLTAKCVRPNTYYYVHTIYKSNHSKYRAPTYICETNSKQMYWQLSCSHSSIGPQCPPYCA